MGTTKKGVKMSYFPLAIYKNGKLSARKGDSCRVNNIGEVLAKAQEGFLPWRCNNIEDIANIPELKFLLAKEQSERVIEEVSSEIVDEIIEEPKMIETKPRRRRRKKSEMEGENNV